MAFRGIFCIWCIGVGSFEVVDDGSGEAYLNSMESWTSCVLRES